MPKNHREPVHHYCCREQAETHRRVRWPSEFRNRISKHCAHGLAFRLGRTCAAAGFRGVYDSPQRNAQSGIGTNRCSMSMLGRPSLRRLAKLYATARPVRTEQSISPSAFRPSARKRSIAWRTDYANDRVTFAIAR